MSEDKKTASSPGRLWGWPNREEEEAYVERIKKSFTVNELNPEEPPHDAVIAWSQLIAYPEHGLQCIQTETWVRLNAGN